MAERHHYVPKMLLKHFSLKDKIWLYDKHTKKSFSTNISNAFVEGDYNTIKHSRYTLEAEHVFTKSEDLSAPIVQRIVTERSINSLTEDEHIVLASFVTIQMLRSKQFRRTFMIFREHMKERFPILGFDDVCRPGMNIEETDKFESIKFCFEALPEFTTALMEKDLVLIENNTPKKFWISDNPVTMHNDTPRDKFWSNIGLKCTGIQVYMPLSPKYAIAFFCRSIRDELERSLKKMKDRSYAIKLDLFRLGAGSRAGFLAAEIASSMHTVEQMIADIHTNKRISFKTENSIFFNSLQMVGSHRFIGAQKGDFDLAADMLRTNPELRSPNLFSFQ
jgi:hypothetical protein